MKDHSSEILVAGFSTGILNLATILQMSAVLAHKIRKKQIGIAIFSLCDAPMKSVNWDNKQRVYCKHTERGEARVNSFLIISVPRT
jgi:hypothetical protein